MPERDSLFASPTAAPSSCKRSGPQSRCKPRQAVALTTTAQAAKIYRTTEFRSPRADNANEATKITDAPSPRADSPTPRRPPAKHLAIGDDPDVLCLLQR